MRNRCVIFCAVISFAVLALCASTSEAGILLPQEIGFDAQDLDELTSDADGLAGSAGAPTRSNSLPANEDQEQQGPVDLLHSPLPLQNSSSSSSSSAGAAGFNVVLCLFSSATTITDDGPSGRLAEERRLSLPDPPGNDFLRPPCA